jgi:hypothetical protein
VPNTADILQFSLCELWSRTYTMYLQLRIFRPQYSTERIGSAIADNRTFRSAFHCKFGAKYSAHPPVCLCELWSQPYTRYLQLRIFRLQYSDLSIGAAIVDITWILCALYCKLGANYSAHLPAFAMWTVVPDIYNVFTAPHIWASIFSCRYHRCYCRYRIISMRVILQT